MGNLGIIFILYTFCVLSIAAANPHDNVVLMMPKDSNETPESSIEQWFERFSHAKQTKTKIHFYLQDLLTGEKATVYRVAKSNITSTSPTSFGQVLIIDDLLTVGPEFDSEIVGRAQGMVSLADLHDKALHESLNILFTNGKYKGSTISILGRNPLFNEVRELSIVGGTGIFRMARGFVVTKTRVYDSVLSVYEYTLYVYHYEL